MLQQTDKITQRSVSLPRLAKKSQPKQSLSPNKINQDIHKVKWSMAPKCLVEGHQGQDVLYVCVNPQCQESTRLVCQSCFFKTHQKHNEQMLALDEIKSGDIEKLRYWPFEQKYSNIFEFVRKHQGYVSSMIQDINGTFQGMALRVLSSIDKMRLDVLKRIDSFYLRERVKSELRQRMKEELQNCFGLRTIRQIVRGLLTKQNKHSVFQQRMNKFLNDSELNKKKEVLYHLFEKSDKGKDIFFDKMLFLNKENFIIEQIQQQQNTLQSTQLHTHSIQTTIDKILPTTLAYLEKETEGKYPLTFDKKILEDGTQYIGFEHKGLRTVFGMRKYPKTGFVYYGEWRINAKNGWGVLQNKKRGYKYSGSWKQDKKNGYGREETLTSVYEGNFVGDKKEGFGILTKDGVRYEIEWRNDKMNGAGKRIQLDGEQAEVYYINGMQSKVKSGKSSLGVNLKELTKKFGTSSNAEKTRSN